MDAEHRSTCLDAYLETTRSRRVSRNYFEGEIPPSRCGILRYPETIDRYDDYLSFSAYSMFFDLIIINVFLVENLTNPAQFSYAFCVLGRQIVPPACVYFVSVFLSLL